jgi:hypothetical protein
VPSGFESYLKNRGIHGPWGIDGCSKGLFAGAVVIPALAESNGIIGSLSSLALNPPSFLSRFLVLVVVNHREDASHSDKVDNGKSLELLADFQRTNSDMCLAWVDAASTGYELPGKHGGVGLARKIGMDLALRLLNPSVNPLLICLDADTVVEPNYLQAIESHFAVHSAGGAVIPFCHRSGGTPEEERAIIRYELYLRTYILGLSLACSPYAFHTVGSAMACRASAYVKMGGMNTRCAAEDFYFLQHLSKVVGVAAVQGTCVHPSPRQSHRVPFGTGRSVSRLVAGDPQAVMFYRRECFDILGSWLQLIREQNDADEHELLQKARLISSSLAAYLEEAGFPRSWSGFRKQFRSSDLRLKAFHDWFDALKTMKCVHHLSDHAYARCQPEMVVPELLGAAGLPQPAAQREQLSLLQQLQNGITVPLAAPPC